MFIFELIFNSWLVMVEGGEIAINKKIKWMQYNLIKKMILKRRSFCVSANLQISCRKSKII